MADINLSPAAQADLDALREHLELVGKIRVRDDGSVSLAIRDGYRTVYLRLSDDSFESRLCTAGLAFWIKGAERQSPNWIASQKLLARDAVDAELSFAAALIGSYVNFRGFDGRPLDVETAKTERGVKVVAIDHDLTIGEFVDHVVFFDCAQAGGIQFGSDGSVLVKDGKVVVLGRRTNSTAAA